MLRGNVVEGEIALASPPAAARAQRGLLIELLAVLLLTAGVALPLRVWALDALPPGLYQDEAAEGLDALAILDGARPVFLPSQNGREPFFAYVVALVYLATGPGAYGIRLAAALLGTLTVPATYLWVRTAFDRRTALFASVLLAVLYWHVHESRLGLRAVALPLLQAVAAWLLWVALRRDRVAWWALAGGAAGLTLYAYLPARLFLAVLFIAAVFALGRRARVVAGRKALAHAAGALLIWLTAAALVALPLLLYLRDHPEDLVGRAGQVSIANAIRAGADPVDLLARNAVKTAGMLAVRGDENPRHNLPGRPIFDPLMLLAGAAGLWLVARRWRWPPCTFLLLWLVVLAVPPLLSDSAPHMLRAVGWLPALVVLPALALARASRWGDRCRAWPALGKRAAWLALALPLLSGGLAARDYFVDLPSRPEVAPAFDADVVAAVGRAWGPATEGSGPALLGPLAPDHPTVALLSAIVQRRAPPTPPLRLFDDRVVPLVAPARYLFVGQDPSVEELVRARLPGGEVREGSGGVAEYMVPAGTRLTLEGSAHTSDLAYRDGSGPVVARLAGWEARPAARADARVQVTLYWAVESAPSAPLRAELRLMGPNGRAWSSVEHAPDTAWQVGEVRADRFTLRVPEDAFPGRYEWQVRLRHGALGPLVARAVSGEEIGTWAPLGPLVVERPARPIEVRRLNRATVLDLAFLSPGGATAAELLGARAIPTEVSAGEALPIALYWRAGPAPPPEATVALDLVGEDGQVAAALREAPGRGAFPATAWQEGDIWRDDFTLPLPANLAPGRYEVRTGLLASPAGPPLRTRQGEEMVRLHRLQVSAPRITTTLPPLAHQVGARFGEVATLAGYEAAWAEDGEARPLRLRLVWQASAPSRRPLSVFVHLLDATGGIASQADAPPASGSAPSDRWQARQVVVDEHLLAVPPALAERPLRVAVGLYDPSTGERVPVVTPDGAAVGDHVELAVAPSS